MANLQPIRPPALTRRQRDVLECIGELMAANGCSPTLREIARLMGISFQAVQEHLDHLEERGAITRMRGARSGITVLAK